MTLLVDTSVWSLAFRRDRPVDAPEVAALTRALGGAEDVVSIGLIKAELLWGFVPPAVESALEDRFAVMRLIEPHPDDYVAAARIGRLCRSAGVQIGLVDAVIAQVAIANDLTLLTTDRDFAHAAEHVPLRLWSR